MIKRYSLYTNKMVMVKLPINNNLYLTTDSFPIDMSNKILEWAKERNLLPGSKKSKLTRVGKLDPSKSIVNAEKPLNEVKFEDLFGKMAMKGTKDATQSRAGYRTSNEALTDVEEVLYEYSPDGSGKCTYFRTNLKHF